MANYFQDQMAATFKHYDVDKSNYLEKSEFKKFFQDMQAASGHSDVSDALLDKVFALWDTDHLGHISLAEFVAGLTGYSSNFLHAAIREVFCHYDINHTGMLEKDEFRKFFRDYIETAGGIDFSDAAVDKAFAAWDTDKKGDITWDEFCVGMLKK